MSRKKKRKIIENSLTTLAAGIGAAQMTGGSTLSSYGTIAHSNNYSLLTLNRIILTYLFTGNGIFQTVVQEPIQDAIRNGFELESGEMSAEDIDILMEWWEEKKLWKKILDFWTWVRLFGGGAIIINTNQNPEKPLNMKTLGNSPIEFYDTDRWQIDTATFSKNNDLNPEYSWDQEYYYFYGQKIHTSRVLRGEGQSAPSYVRRQLRGWGLSVGENCIRDINLYLKTQDVLYEILDEAKIDIYKIKGLANKLLTAGGTSAITNRILSANMIKSHVNALVLDSSEDYEQKSLTFAGLAEVMNENRMNVAAAVKFPVTKLFGISASGFNTGESDLENYNSMVESEVRKPLTPVVRECLNIGMMCCFGYVPSYKIKWPALRVLSALDEETIKSSQTNRTLLLYDRGLLDSKEVGEIGRKESWLTIETKAEKGKLPPQPAPPNGSDAMEMPDEKIQGNKTDKSEVKGKSGDDGDAGKKGKANSY